MAKHYTTPEHIWTPTHYNTGANFVYADSTTGPLFELLSLRSGERVMDMGCGTGELTVRLQELTGEEGLVLGVDASEAMLEIAKKNGVKNQFCCDIQNFVMPDRFKELTGRFDAVFTNSTLHWCKRDPHGPVKAAKSLLKPGGRFVGEFCGHTTGIGERRAFSQVLRGRGINPPDPWFFPRPAEYAEASHADSN